MLKKQFRERMMKNTLKELHLRLDKKKICNCFLKKKTILNK